MSSKNQKKKLQTDKNTDYLFEYFMDENKFNEQMKPEWNKEVERKLENHRQQNLNNKIMSERNSSSSVNSGKELPSSDVSSNSSKTDVDFNDDDSDDDGIGDTGSGDGTESSVQSSVKSPYGQKIEGNPMPPFKPKSEAKPKEVVSEKPLLGQTLVGDIQKYVETPEERRARARDEYSKLQDLVENKGVKLSRPYTIDDDPDEMKAEYDMHKARRHKNNQVKFYKQVLLNIVCGVEFLNDRYNPFEFKLKDWSKQVAADMDDYSEVLEEIYEKYKDRGGKMSPEIRLLFMIIMSGVTYHLSQALFGSGGLDNTIKNNPNIINKLLGGLMKGGIPGMGSNEHEPPEAKEPPRNNSNILATIRKYNQNKNTDNKTDTLSQQNTLTTDTKTENNSSTLSIEREKRILAEQEAKFQEKLRKQQELHMAELDRMRNQQLQQTLTTNSQQYQPTKQQQSVQPVQYPNYQLPTQSNNQPVNQVLSDISKKPRFLENNAQKFNLSPKNSFKELSDELGIFDSEIKENKNKTRFSSIKRPKKPNLDELIESLEESIDVDIDQIIESSSRKKNNKPIMSIRKPRNNSASRSVSRKRGSDTGSDIISSAKRNNIIKL